MRWLLLVLALLGLLFGVWEWRAFWRRLELPREARPGVVSLVWWTAVLVASAQYLAWVLTETLR